MKKAFLLSLAVFALSTSALGQSLPAVSFGGPATPTTGIFVNSATSPPGLTVQFIAQAVLGGPLANPITNQCVWASSNTGVATINANGLATAVSAGSANITCSSGGLVGTGAFVVGPGGGIAITAPNCGTPPCPLAVGTNGIAYSYTLTALGGVLPYTWTVSTGSLPGWASLNAGTGAITGTAATGTTNFSVTVTDSTPVTPLTATLAVTLTVGSSGPTCGPPTYSCTPTISTQPGAFAPVVVPFSGQGTAGSGVDNTLVNDPEPVGSGNTSGLYHNPWVRITNVFSGCGNQTEPACPSTKQNTSFFADGGGSGDVNHWSTDSTLFDICDAGGTSYFYAFNPSTMQATFKYSNYFNALKMGGGCAISFSRSAGTNSTVYVPTNSTGTTSGTFLNKYDVSVNYPTLPTPVLVYNFTTSPNCLPNTVTNSTDPPNVGVNGGADTVFIDGFSTSGSQNTGRYIASYKVGSGCSVWNTQTNTITGDWGTTGTAVCRNCVVSTASSSVSVNVPTSGHPEFATFVVTSSLGFNVGDSVLVAGNSNSALNGTFPVLLVTDSTHIQLTTSGLAGQTGTGGTLTDTTPSPGTFTLHNTKASLDGVWAIVSIGICDVGSVCGNGTSPYFWQVGTTNVYTKCPNTCSGHFTTGYGTFVNQYNTPFWGATTFASPLTSTIFPATYCASYSQIYDTHPGWNNDDPADDHAFFTATSSETVLPDYSKCAVNEILGIFGPAAGALAGTVSRQGHTYGVPTPCFAVQITVTSISQDGRFVLLSSPMNASLGCMDGTTSCAVSASGACTSSHNAPRGDVFVMKLQ
jgi:hypothetical protein